MLIFGESGRAGRPPDEDDVCVHTLLTGQDGERKSHYRSHLHMYSTSDAIPSYSRKHIRSAFVGFTQWSMRLRPSTLSARPALKLAAPTRQKEIHTAIQIHGARRGEGPSGPVPALVRTGTRPISRKGAALLAPSLRLLPHIVLVGVRLLNVLDEIAPRDELPTAARRRRLSRWRAWLTRGLRVLLVRGWSRAVHTS